MPKAAGRLAVISRAATPIAGVKSTTIKVENESITVTDRDSNGFQEFLAAAAGRSLTLDVEGVYTSPVLRDVAFDPALSQLLTDITFRFSDALAAKDTIAGNFWLSSYEESNPDDGATDFKCTFTSSGPWTHS